MFRKINLQIIEDYIEVGVPQIHGIYGIAKLAEKDIASIINIDSTKIKDFI